MSKKEKMQKALPFPLFFKWVKISPPHPLRRIPGHRNEFYADQQFYPDAFYKQIIKL